MTLKQKKAAYESRRHAVRAIHAPSGSSLKQKKAASELRRDIRRSR